MAMPYRIGQQMRVNNMTVIVTGWERDEDGNSVSMLFDVDAIDLTPTEFMRLDTAGRDQLVELAQRGVTVNIVEAK